MAEKPSRQTLKILKQILLLALPLILKLLRSRKSGGSKSAKSVEAPAKPKPIRAKKRPSTQPLPAPPSRSVRRSPIAQEHAQQRSDTILTDAGVIVKVLPDDNDGSRHQRFLLEVDHTNITVKIAHNIDLAPRVPAREGDRLEFKGEYEYNDLGGAVHWTHHDPKKWREGGWIDHDGKRYE